MASPSSPQSPRTGNSSLRRLLVVLLAAAFGAWIYTELAGRSEGSCRLRAENRVVTFDRFAALVAELRSEEPCFRAEAAKDISRFGRAARSVLPELVALSEDPVPFPRWRAVTAFGDIGVADPILVSPVRRLLKDPDPTVRLNATYAWSLLKFPELGREAEPALRDGFHPLTRMNALAELELIIPDVLERRSRLRELLADSHGDVRYAAVDKVADSGDRDLLDAVIPLLSDSDPRVRGAAAAAVRKLGGHRLKSTVAANLADSDESARERKEWALRGLDSSILDTEGVIRRLEVSIGKDRERLVGAVGSLGKDGTPFVQTLLMLLDSEDAVARSYVVESLARILGADEAAVNIAVRGLDSKSPYVVVGVLGALREMKRPPAESLRSRIESCATHSDGEVRATAAMTLGRMPPALSTEQTLIRLLTDPVFVAAEAAAVSLGTIGATESDSAIRILRSLRRTASFEPAALYALGAIAGGTTNELDRALELAPHSARFAERAYARFASERLGRMPKTIPLDGRIDNLCWAKGRVTEGPLFAELRRILDRQSDSAASSSARKANATVVIETEGFQPEVVPFDQVPGYQLRRGAFRREWINRDEGFVVTEFPVTSEARVAEYAGKQISFAAFSLIRNGGGDWHLGKVLRFFAPVYPDDVASPLRSEVIDALMREAICSLP